MNRRSFLSLLVMLSICFCTAAQAEPYDKYLSTADIEKVTGFKEVKLSQSSQTKTAGSLKFKNKDGKVILLVRFNSPSFYNKSEATKLGQIKGEIKGIGEDAYYGPNVDTPYMLSFKKDKLYVELSAFINSKDVMPFLTMEQLKALGKIIASRI
jgi:hypothetical protein